MSVLLTRGTRLSQPQGPVEVDWADPIARGLVSSINPALNDALRIGSPSIGTGDRGRSLVGNGSSFLYKNTPAFASAATILYVGNLRSITLSFVASIGTSGGGNQIFGIQGGDTVASSPPRAVIRVANGGGTSTVEISGATASTNYTSNDVWVARYDGTNQLKIYRNGVDVSGTRTSTAASGAMSSMDNFALGGLNRGTDGFAGTGQSEFLGLAWDRALSDAEIASISANPWQLFKPVQRRVWFDGGAAAGGASQTIAFTLDDLTASVSQTLSHSQSAAFTLDGISSTVNQAVTHSQSLSATLDDVTASISQELAGAKSQSIAFTLDGITASVSQTASHAQSLAVTLDDVTVSISQSAAPSSKDQSLAITLDDIFVDIKQAGPRRRQAGGKRNYIIKGKKYHLNDYELAVMIQGMLEEVERSDVEIDDGEAVKKVSRRVWKQLKESNAQLDFTLKELQSKVAIQDIDDEDDIALLML